MQVGMGDNYDFNFDQLYMLQFLYGINKVLYLSSISLCNTIRNIRRYIPSKNCICCSKAYNWDCELIISHDCLFWLDFILLLHNVYYINYY